MSRFFKLYYIFNVIGLLYYPLVRMKHNSPKLWVPEEFAGFAMTDDRETQVFVVLGTILALKFIRSPTLDAYFSTVFLFCRVSFTMLLYLIDVWVMAWFLIIQVSLWVLFTQPLYDGPHKFLPISTLEQFEKSVIQSDATWVILFHSDLHQSCVHTYQLWAEMSIKYSTEKLLFGIVNVDRCPEAAKRCTINTDGGTRQLPSLVMYENEKETARFPPIDKEGNIALVRMWKKDKIAQYLEIDKKYLETRNTSSS